MKIGYARVSTQDQKLELQKDALSQAGCEMIFEERPQIGLDVRKIMEGDKLVVWKLDRDYLSQETRSYQQQVIKK